MVHQQDLRGAARVKRIVYRNSSNFRFLATLMITTPSPLSMLSASGHVNGTRAGCHVPGGRVAHGLPHLHLPTFRAVLRYDRRRDRSGGDAVQLQPCRPGRQRGSAFLQVGRNRLDLSRPSSLTKRFFVRTRTFFLSVTCNILH